MPASGKLSYKKIIYRAEVVNSSNDHTSNYIGLTEHSFKDRLYKHRNSFKYKNKVNSTELSKHIWELKDNQIDNVKIHWSVLDRAPAYQNGAKHCDLCLTEEFHIIYQDFKTLNSRNELLSNCRHKSKHMLANFKEIPPDTSPNDIPR